ncbi:MAG: nucleotidyltransferase domain-containing protein [Cyclobacteriaceae bacterium]
MNLLERNIKQINELCQLNSVKALYAFGSITSRNFTDDSDVDLVVDIGDPDPISYSDKYFNLKFSLEDTLGRTVDLLESKAIKNPYLKDEIDRTKVLVYEYPIRSE